MARKKFKDLNLTDAFLFAAAMANPEVSKDTLEILLGQEIGRITVNVEQSLMFSSDSRSVRLDVFCEDDVSNSYNVEMQGENEGNLPKRSRFHQAEMDVLSLKPGEDFEALKPNYVIFICNFDPFGAGFYRYTFSNVCEENGMPLGDGTKKIFFNIMGKNAVGVSEELINLLRYMKDSSDENVSAIGEHNRIGRIHKHIVELKKNREWERCYMRLDEYLSREVKKACIEASAEARKKALAEGRAEGIEEGRAEGRAEGIAEGRAEGRAEGIANTLVLIGKMLVAGESEEAIKHLAEDEKYLEEMCKKYLGTKE